MNIFSNHTNPLHAFSLFRREGVRGILSFVFFLLTPLTLMASDGFGHAQWIGAITREQANIPSGRIFTGGVLKEPAVKAAWQAVDSLSRRSIVLTRSWSRRKKIKRAVVNICGLGFYEFSINGTKVGDAVMAPLWSDYDKTVFYNTYDVTCELQRRNEFSVLLGNGFYNEQGGRYRKLLISFGPPTLLFHMNVTYTDGSTEQLVSDGSWQWQASPLVFNSLYGGEDYDARLEANTPRYPVVIQQAPKGMLRPQIAKPVKIMERFDVARRLPHQVLDMGQNLAGFPEITVRGKAGQTVKLWLAETLTDDGHINQRQTGRPYYVSYTLKGGVETWHPRFTYYGFRYIGVEGAVMQGDDNAEGLPVIEKIQSCFVYNSAEKIGNFECSDTRLNTTYRIIDRAIRSNWQSVWTDCPHREKLGWLEQDWLNGEGLMYNYDCRAMIEQTMRQIADAQHDNGAVPTTAPEYTYFRGRGTDPFAESPEWGGAFVALPFNYMRHYGSDKLIREYYPQMKRYVDYLATQDSAYILSQGLGDWYDYTGERAGFSKNTPVPLVSTAHYYQWTKKVAQAAKLTGRDADAHSLQMRADSIKQAFISHFTLGSQTAYSIALEMGLYRDGERQRVLEALVADIRSHGTRLTTGDVGNRYLFRSLINNGHADLLYDMLDHDGVPGYGNQVKKGMTTLTEQWDPDMGSSMNHFMLAHINNHLIPDFLGIQIEGSRVTIAPHPVDKLTWCKGSTLVSEGCVKVYWRIENGLFVVETDVPSGVDATLVMPGSGDKIKLKGTERHTETWTKK